MRCLSTYCISPRFSSGDERIGIIVQGDYQTHRAEQRLIIIDRVGRNIDRIERIVAVGTDVADETVAHRMAS